VPSPKKQTVIKTKKKTGTVIDRIAPVHFEEEGVKLNIYGMSGSGKTTFWSTFPKPILAIICSGKGELRSLSLETRKVVEAVELENSDEVTDLVEYLKDDGSKFKTVVFDHLTRFQDLILKEVVGLDEIPEQSSWGLATQEQYGQVTMQAKERLRGLLNLKQNVILIAQQREFNVDQKSDALMPYVASALSPSLVGWLNPAVDYICQTYLAPKMVVKTKTVGGKPVTIRERGEGVDFCLRTAPNEVYTTKFRIPKGSKLPDRIVNPTYEKFIKLVRGEQ
jgi:hypothetical protein